MNIAYFVWVRKRLEIVVFFCRLCRAKPYYPVKIARTLRKLALALSSQSVLLRTGYGTAAEPKPAKIA